MPPTIPPTPPIPPALPLPRPACDRDAPYLTAAGRGALTLVTEYGAQRYCEDRSGPHTGYLAPPPPGLFTAGWLARDGDRIGITAEGRTALADYQRRRAAADDLPYTMTRSPLRGELHRPDEPVRRLRRAATGEEIKPGDTVTDPSGHQATYLGPTMHSDDGGATWTPAFNARVTYRCHGAWLYPPVALGAFYEREFTLPGSAMTPTRDPRPAIPDWRQP